MSTYLNIMSEFYPFFMEYSKKKLFASLTLGCDGLIFKREFKIPNAYNANDHKRLVEFSLSVGGK